MVKLCVYNECACEGLLVLLMRPCKEKHVEQKTHFIVFYFFAGELKDNEREYLRLCKYKISKEVC